MAWATWQSLNKGERATPFFSDLFIGVPIHIYDSMLAQVIWHSWKWLSRELWPPLGSTPSFAAKIQQFAVLPLLGTAYLFNNLRRTKENPEKPATTESQQASSRGFSRLFRRSELSRCVHMVFAFLGASWTRLLGILLRCCLHVMDSTLFFFVIHLVLFP